MNASSVMYRKRKPSALDAESSFAENAICIIVRRSFAISGEKVTLPTPRNPRKKEQKCLNICPACKFPCVLEYEHLDKCRDMGGHTWLAGLPRKRRPKQARLLIFR